MCVTIHMTCRDVTSCLELKRLCVWFAFSSPFTFIRTCFIVNPFRMPKHWKMLDSKASTIHLVDHTIESPKNNSRCNLLFDCCVANIDIYQCCCVCNLWFCVIMRLQLAACAQCTLMCGLWAQQSYCVTLLCLSLLFSKMPTYCSLKNVADCQSLVNLFDALHFLNQPKIDCVCRQSHVPKVCEANPLQHSWFNQWQKQQPINTVMCHRHQRATVVQWMSNWNTARPFPIWSQTITLEHALMNY